MYAKVPPFGPSHRKYFEVWEYSALDASPHKQLSTDIKAAHCYPPEQLYTGIEEMLIGQDQTQINAA